MWLSWPAQRRVYFRIPKRPSSHPGRWSSSELQRALGQLPSWNQREQHPSRCRCASWYSLPPGRSGRSNLSGRAWTSSATALLARRLHVVGASENVSPRSRAPFRCVNRIEVQVVPFAPDGLPSTNPGRNPRPSTLRSPVFRFRPPTQRLFGYWVARGRPFKGCSLDGLLSVHGVLSSSCRALASAERVDIKRLCLATRTGKSARPGSSPGPCTRRTAAGPGVSGSS